MKLRLRNPVSPARLRIAVGGDFCPGPHGSALARAGRAAEVLAPLAPFLADADLRLVQFETPLVSTGTPIPKTGPNLASAPESADILRCAFDIALLANNHVGDHGPAAVLATIRELRSRGIATVGAGATLAEAEAPLVIERGGVRLAVFNFAEFEFGIADANTPGVAPGRPEGRTAAAPSSSRATRRTTTTRRRAASRFAPTASTSRAPGATSRTPSGPTPKSRWSSMPPERPSSA